jgi:sigma-B regulation protein RsbU (phosphoserine phosphatase)
MFTTAGRSKMGRWCDVLADDLEKARAELLHCVDARAADEPRSHRGATFVLDALITALRAANGATSSHCKKSSDTAADRFLAEVKWLKEAVYARIDAQQLAVSAAEMRFVAEWFATFTERILRQQNSRFTAMLDALPDHVAMHDRRGQPIYVNRIARKNLEAAIGGPLLEDHDFVVQGFPPALVKQLEDEFALAEAGQTVTSEGLFPTPDGPRWRERHISPVFGDGGELEGIAVASRDIHARKRAEARLQLLSKVGELAETMDYEGVVSAVARLSIPELADWCVVDVVEDEQPRRGKVAHVDPEKAALAEELLGQRPSKTSHHPKWQRLMAGESLMFSDLSDEILRDHGAPDSFRNLVTQLEARSVLTVPFVVLGTVVAVANFFFTAESERHHGPEDKALGEELARRAAQIIENARLHQQLRQSETRFRVALAHSNIAVFEEDACGRVRWVYNPLFGLDADEVVGRTGADLALRSTSKELTALKQSVLDSGERARTEVEAVVGGERRHLLMNYEPLREAGGIVGLMGAAVDITEAKQVQEQLAQELGFREQLMGVLSHDLRNPLGAVLGLSGLLALQDGLPANMSEGLDQIQQSARRMNEMIETLLDVTRLRQRRGMPLSRQQVDLLALSRKVADELRAAHPEREIRLAARGDVNGHWDPARIEQVASNLVANALTHGAAASPVELTLAGDGSDVQLEVTNRGQAIAPDLIDHLFEPFRQGAAERAKPRPSGLGLGLFIARQIVRSHGGTIAVKSDDEATTFTVRLPRVAAETETHSLPAAG